MFDRIDILRMSADLAAHATQSQTVTARNVANADTPGYRAQALPDFAEVFDRAAFAPRHSRPGHIMSPTAHTVAARPEAAEGPEGVNGNSVSLETEMFRAGAAKRDHDTALAIYRSSLELMRAALGRGR